MLCVCAFHCSHSRCRGSGHCRACCCEGPSPPPPRRPCPGSPPPASGLPGPHSPALPRCQRRRRGRRQSRLREGEGPSPRASRPEASNGRARAPARSRSAPCAAARRGAGSPEAGAAAAPSEGPSAGCSPETTPLRSLRWVGRSAARRHVQHGEYPRGAGVRRLSALTGWGPRPGLGWGEAAARGPGWARCGPGRAELS